MEQAEIVRILLGERVRICALLWVVLRDTHAADDVFQDTVVKAIDDTGRFRDEEHLRAWVRVTSRNRAIDLVRRHDRRAVPLSEAVLDRVDAALASRSAETTGGRVDALLECAEGLPERSRSLVDLRYRAGLKGTEVAQRLGQSVDAVYKALSRLHRSLRECVERRLGDSSAPEGAVP